MDVTRSNFQKLMPDIEATISGADFLCIDGEFTGLRTGRGVNAFDTPTEYYQNVLSSSSDFLLVQFGLCAFRWDEESEKFRHSAFNFYLFPRPQHSQAPDKIFSCQSSSMDFLAAQKFDFNKLFYEGISYLSTSEELKMREDLEEKNTYDRNVLSAKCNESDAKVSKEALIAIPSEHAKQIEEICDQVSDFVKSDNEGKLEFGNLNPFVRKLVYQELEERFDSKLFLETNQDSNQKRVLCVSKALTKGEMKSKVEEKICKQWRELEEAVGFSQVIRKISKSGKLVVGHCLLLDLLHVLNQFFSPLPEDYQEFKDFAKCTFPRILDTMYIASLPEFKDLIPYVNLANLMTRMSEEPFQIPSFEPETGKNQKGYELSGSKFHEAGYDAFTTGLCFVSLFQYLASKQHLTLKQVTINAECGLVKPYMNKIFLFKTSPQGSPYINLTGKDMNPSRDNVFHMVFPENWKRSDIYDLFSPFGGVFVSFIGQTSAYVALRRRDQLNHVLSRLQRSPKYTLTPFLKYKASTLKIVPKNQPGRQGQPDPAELTKKRKVPSESRGNNDMHEEDLGEPIPRDCPPPAEGPVKRRRTSSSCSEGAPPPPPRAPRAYGAPRRRRTSSGTFTVKDAGTVAEAKQAEKKNSFHENNDWD